MIRDLLALQVDASWWLPADTYLGNFDNMSDAQGLSTTLLEAYLRAATDVSRLAVGNPAALPKSVKYTNPIEVSQHAWDHIEGAPYGTRGGMVVTHNFAADGEYVFSIETLFGNGTGFEDIDISIDGEGRGSPRSSARRRLGRPDPDGADPRSCWPAPSLGSVRPQDRRSLRGSSEPARFGPSSGARTLWTGPTTESRRYHTSAIS